MRIRVASHGPPLRNINGDSHSLLEEDVNDQTHQFIANGSSLDNSNLVVSASGNQLNLRTSLQQHYHSDDSVLDFEEEEKHQALPMRNH